MDRELDTAEKETIVEWALLIHDLTAVSPALATLLTDYAIARMRSGAQAPVVSKKLVAGG